MLLGEDLKEEGPCQESGSTCREGRRLRSSSAPERIKAPGAFGAPNAAFSHDVPLQHLPLTPTKMWCYKGLSSEKEGEDQAHLRG